MDRDEALELLKDGAQGIAEWNRRRVSGEEIPELKKADLTGADLSSANLNRANLNDADLIGANLIGANLIDANLGYANLSFATLKGANLGFANLNGAELSFADLSGAFLMHAKFAAAAFFGANVEHANCGSTVFANVNLSNTKGLESVRHDSPSTLGVDTIFRSKGTTPEPFLHGCGVPEALIAYLPALISSMEPIQFYSCFISYSTADEEFATRLHNDFQAAGIRCWKWDHDARTGRSLWGEIDQAIRVYDKLVLIASESSLKSPAVNREIERAIVQEDERLKRNEKGEKQVDADVLFPVTLDAYIFTKWNHERKVDVTKKVIADAKGWDSDARIYAKVRDKLIRDLKAEASAASPTRTSGRKKPR